FSGGEKKRAEILQMAMLKPEIAIMDETDSGLDIDALKVVAEGVNALSGPDLGVLVITHYNRILHYIKPHRVHVMIDGRIATSGDDVSGIDFQDIYYYVKPTSEESKSWEDIPSDMKRTFDKLGIPEAEQKFLSGVGAQYDSEVVYHKIKESLEKQGVIFLSC